MKADHERVTKLLTDTVTLLCKNGLSYDHELRIQGLLGITVDSSEVFLVSINDCFNCSSSSSPLSVPSSFAGSDAANNGQSRKRSFDNIVDLTRLVETPQVHTEVQPSQLSSSISLVHHGIQTRPKSTGSVGQSRSQAVTPSSSNRSQAVTPSSLNMSLTRHSQQVARQPPFGTVLTAGHPSTTTVRRNTAEHLTLANNQHGNAMALVDPYIRPGHRPRAGYMDSLHNLMLTCERQLVPRCCPHGQQHRQLPPAGTSGWTGTEQQHSMQLQPMHQNMATVGAAAAGNLETVGRPGAEHFGFQPHPSRQAVQRNACVQRSQVNPSHYVYANTAVPGVVGPTSMLSRQPCADVLRPVYRDHSQDVGNVPQMYAAAVQGRQLVDSAAMQPPAKRRTPNHLPRQAVQSFNPAFVQCHFSHPHSYFPHSDSTSVSQQAYSVADPHAVSSLPLSSTSASQASCIMSSPSVKPPSSPVQSGRRLRPRQVEHIDLCDDEDDDETADSGIHIPVSSIVIQPDNIDMLAAADEAERPNVVSVNTSDSSFSEFELVPENSLSGTDLPPLTRILEIVPLDDGNDLEDSHVSAAAVAAENTGQSAYASVSVAVVTSELSDSGRNSGACNHQDSELSTAQPDVSRDLLRMLPHTFTDSQLARLSADEITQMAELCFDAEDNAQM